MVGQKNVLPNPYSVAAARIIPPVAFERNMRPHAAIRALAHRRPSGESLCTIGPAKNRSTSMMADV